jgi:hypothetical protein
MMEMHIEAPPPRLDDFSPDCPKALAELIDNLLAKHAGQRPDSASEVATALQAILADSDAEYVVRSEPKSAASDQPVLLTERLWDDSHSSREISWWALGAVAVLATLVVAVASIST